MKTMQKMKRSAFTLIELLVVIVIIGILLAVLFPAISKALSASKASALMQQGVGISKAVLQFNLPGSFDGDVYPVSTGTNTFATSTDYFKYMMQNGMVGNQDFSLFGGAGAAPVKTLEAIKFKGRNNAWNVVQDMLTAPSDNTAFLFSRNLVITELPDGVANTENLEDKLDNTTDNRLQFANTHLVVVTRGGNGYVYESKQLTVGNATKLNPTDKKLKVLQPGPDN